LLIFRAGSPEKSFAKIATPRFFFFAGSSYGNCLIDDEHINIFFFTPGKAAFTSMSFS
jgi:hypothetical protein